MTFYDAALLVLEREGKPLSFKAITERAIAEKLLSHIGKDPEAVMYNRLIAVAKRKGDRKVIVTAVGTFGLLDWGFAEDEAALDAKVLPEPDETEPPLRPRERHPIPQASLVRLSGRGERGRRRDGEERPERAERPDRAERPERTERPPRKGKLLPLPELAFEVLSQATGSLSAIDIAATLREADKVSEDLSGDALLSALREDNRRRQQHDRRPLFLIDENHQVSLDKAVPVEVVIAADAALPALEQRPEARLEKAGPGVQRVLQQVKEHQKNIARVLRRRAGELEVGGLELLGLALLEAHGFREVRAAKRGKEGPTLTAKRREGLLDARYAIRLIKGSRELTQKDIVEFRRDLAPHNAQISLLIGAGEVSRDARTEAQAGNSLMLVWCGEALAEKLLEKKVGSTVHTIEIPDADDAFFRKLKDQGEQDDRRRDERQKDREKSERVSHTPTPPVLANAHMLEPITAESPAPVFAEPASVSAEPLMVPVAPPAVVAPPGDLLAPIKEIPVADLPPVSGFPEPMSAAEIDATPAVHPDPAAPTLTVEGSQVLSSQPVAPAPAPAPEAAAPTFEIRVDLSASDHPAAPAQPEASESLTAALARAAAASEPAPAPAAPATPPKPDSAS